MKCFVIMPFGNPKEDPQHSRKLELIYSQWIKPTVESIECPSIQGKKLECHRADKSKRPEEIIAHIIENLVTSDIIIADLSGRNPNVFYELGVRHAVNNNTILIADDLDDIPFDLRGLRTIVYQYDPEHMVELRNSLEQAIKEILSKPDQIDNPVRRFLYNREVDKFVRQATPPGYDVFKEVISEMESLKKEFRHHVDEVRHIMKLVTSDEQSLAPIKNQQSIDVSLFEGAWEDTPTHSMFYVRIVNNELLVAYCYAGDSELTARFYNCKVIDDTLFARFEWFEALISGYVFLKVISKNKLSGGWWYRQDVPIKLRDDISSFDDSIPGMNRSILVRRNNISRFPVWAENYFKSTTKK